MRDDGRDIDFNRRCAIEVHLRPNEDVAHLIKRFIRRVRDSGLIQDARIKSRYEKPSERKKRKRMRSVRAAMGRETREK